MDNTDENSTLETLLTEKTVVTKVCAPEQIFVSKGISPTQIQISWSSAEYAASYRLERAVVTSANADGSFTAPAEEAYDVIAASSMQTSSSYITGTTYTDTILSTPSYQSPEYGYAYFYRVCGENTAKKYDASDYAVSAAATLFGPALNVKAGLGETTDHITVTWNKTAYASSYQVYRTTSSDGTNTALVGTVPSNMNWFNNVIDSENQGKEFYYIIYAKNASNITSTASPIALGYSAVEGAPTQVTGVTVTSGRGDGLASDGISISWNAASGSSSIKYAVYRTSSADSAYTLLTPETDAVVYTDKKSLKPNVYYYYQVQAWAIDSDTQTKLKAKLSASSASDNNPAEGYLLSPPASLTVTKNSDGSTCTLVFPAAIGCEEYPSDSKLSSDYNVYTYKIYSCDTENGSYSPLDAVTSAVPSDGYFSVSAASAKFYKVATVNDASAESDMSEAAAPAPYAAKSAAATKREYIAGIALAADGNLNPSAANSSGVFPVKITWSAPDGGADGGYYVYRSAKAASGFRKITDSPVTDLYYIDANDTAKTGTYYYYKVLSLNSLLQGTNYSDVACGYGALTFDQYLREHDKTIRSSQKKLTLMHKSNNLDKLGSETINGDISGTLYYNASVSGVNGVVTMKYTDYCDYYIGGDSTLGPYFTFNGNTNTDANMSSNGSMNGVVTTTGMYPAKVTYNNVEIKGGAAGGGYYIVIPDGFDASKDTNNATHVSYTVGNE